MAHNIESYAVKRVWQSCDAVCFDVDSTVVMEEGLDELAAFLGKGEEIKALTNKAMGGKMTFREALETRLDILKPHKYEVQNFVNQGNLKFTKGLEDLVELLQSRGVDIYLVSGGFHALIRPLALKLNIPADRIYANKLKYNRDGSYAGFDTEQPTSAAGGKPKVAQLLKDTYGYSNLVFIGDGATDAEASPPADAFIGFGGNVVRESVKAISKWYVYNFQEMIQELTGAHES